jgi:hypothetical protein
MFGIDGPTVSDERGFSLMHELGSAVTDWTFPYVHAVRLTACLAVYEPFNQTLV